MKIFLVSLVIFFSFSTISAQDYKFGKVSKEELEEKYYELDSSANAVILYKSRDTYFEYNQEQGFQVVTDVQERIKLYNAEGFGWATKKVKLYQSSSAKEKITNLKATTFVLENDKVIEVDLGKNDVFDEEINKYWSEQKFTMPNLSPGCIIEWKYKITSPFYSIDEVQFQYSIPVKKLEVSIETPEYFVYKKNSKGYIFLTPQVDKKQRSITIINKVRGDGVANRNAVVQTSFSQSKIDYTAFKETYTTENVPALIEEPFVDNIKNYFGAMEYEYSELHWPNEPIKFYASTWDDVTKSIYSDSDFSNQIYKSNHYTDDLAQVLASAKTDNEKMVAIFELVRQKMKWNDYDGFTTYKGTKQAYKEGVGNAADINLNLVSMLNSAGLTANPVLISTRSNGIPLFPTINGFNFVIAAVEIANGIVLLDATDPNSSPNNLPLRDLNWKGRLIRKDGTSSEIDLSASEPSESTSNVMVAINEYGKVDGVFRKSYKNLNAINYRDKYYKIKDEDIINKIEKNNNIEIEDYKITNKEDVYKPLVEMYKFNSEDLTDLVGNKIYFKPLLFNAENENPFKLEKREYPIDFGAPISDKNAISFTIPEGYQVTSVPESIAIGLPNNLGVYLFDIKVMGDRINVQSQLTINTAIYPAKNYDEIKDFFKIIVNKNLESVVLEKVMP